MNTDKRDRYIGSILKGGHSDRLQERVRAYLQGADDRDDLLPMVYPYLAVWQHDTRKIWYEFVSPRLAALFGCQPDEVSSLFARKIIDRRSYRYLEVDNGMREEVLTRQQLQGEQQDLRRQVRTRGYVEAVYKLEMTAEKNLWLKDWALTEDFEEDGITLSVGSLTDVTSEMDHKEILEQIGYFDELTRLPKRSIMLRILEISIGQVQRGHLQDFVFMMMDIDHFKMVNDTYGHQAGDKVLVELAGLMNALKRKEDEIGRYAGEEFYCIGHGRLKSGRVFAERLRKKIEDHDFRFGGHRIPVTISIGVVAASELETVSVENLVAVADRRLYAAKLLGRNRVVDRDDGKNNNNRRS